MRRASIYVCKYCSPGDYNFARVRVGGGIRSAPTSTKSTPYGKDKLARRTMLERQYRLTKHKRIGGWLIQGSTRCTTRRAGPRRMAFATRSNILIRGGERCRDGPNHEPIYRHVRIILARRAKPDSATRPPILYALAIIL